MTRSIKNNVTLKSTAYNQTGQTFFERLSAFNSMSSHLRRVVLAKSVIDVGNKNYVHTKPKTYKLFDNQSKLLNNSCENIIINDLSCSIHSQSLDELSVSPNSKTRIYQGDHKSRSFDKNNEVHYLYSTVHSESTCKCKRYPLICQKLSSKELNQAPVNTLSDQEIRCKKSILEMNLNYAKELKFAQDITNVQNTVLQQRDEDKQQPQKNIEQSMEKCSSKSSADDKQYSLTLSNTLLKESYLTSQKYIQAIDSQQVTDFNEEEMKYINFLYDITKEIIQSGFYTDKELEDVFDKHIEKNTGMLNMNRMLYEIHQLKLSLNICNDTDVDEELEELIHSQSLLNVSKIKPPMSPMILNKHKVLEKLVLYEKPIDNQRITSDCGNKSAILVTTNPELLITQRDVLMSLMEVDIDPKEAQQICQSLFQKSKTLLDKKVQVKTEVSLPQNLELQKMESKSAEDES